MFPWEGNRDHVLRYSVVIGGSHLELFHALGRLPQQPWELWQIALLIQPPLASVPSPEFFFFKFLNVFTSNSFPHSSPQTPTLLIPPQKKLWDRTPSIK